MRIALAEALVRTCIDYWPVLALSSGHLACCLSRRTRSGELRPVLAPALRSYSPPDIGLLAVLLWGAFANFYAREFFLSGHDATRLPHLLGESQDFLAALVVLFVVVCLDGVGLALNRRRGDSGRLASISGIGLVVRAVVASCVLADWATAMIASVVLVAG